ncbi:MAG TPA: hypothetical protein VFM05_06985 [Candidatus Saccharimonadales bacterium]|nr:hypothetical protein [Candidatus Saccharimonadales bacterium]
MALESELSIEDRSSSAAYALTPAIIDIPVPTTKQYIGLIVVPATRSYDKLEYSMRLAQEASVALVVLSSHGLDPKLIAANFAKAGVRGFSIALPDDYVVPLTADFATHKHKHTVGRISNLSAKRNLGLLLGYLTSTNIFFLDDDIWDITAAKLAIVGSGLEKYALAGFMISEFPDSAVTKHAYRLAGGSLAPDITGNSLAVNADHITTFFPNVYNEDLLFAYDAVATKDAVLLGWAKQLPYDPFKVERALSEGFGSVLAFEGLYTLIASGKTLRDADEHYWKATLKRRKCFLDEVTRRLIARNDKDKRIEPALRAVEASKAQLGTFRPVDFLDYVEAWRDDIALWQARPQTLPRNLSLEKAIEFLGYPSY